MIFVPSYQGISHSPYEWTEWDDLEAGIKVLVDTLKTLGSVDSMAQTTKAG
jgi:N-carbamoyl-L-amino-acid hydrolase